MSEAIEVYAPESWVMIGNDTTATIGKVSINPGGSVCYEVVWWEGMNRKEAWLWHYEIKPIDKTSFLRVGFKS